MQGLSVRNSEVAPPKKAIHKGQPYSSQACLTFLFDSLTLELRCKLLIRDVSVFSRGQDLDALAGKGNTNKLLFN